MSTKTSDWVNLHRVASLFLTLALLDVTRYRNISLTMTLHAIYLADPLASADRDSVDCDEESN